MISDQQRLAAFGSVMAEVNRIGSTVRSQLPEIIERLNIGATGFYVVAPRKNSDGTLRFDSIFNSAPGMSMRNLKIYPHFVEDAAIHEVLARDYTYHSGGYASYNRQYHKIVIHVGEETPQFMGFFFNHELGHALAAIKSGHFLKAEARPQDERAMEESQMWTFDCKLMLALGGETFKRQADEMAYKIMRCHTHQQKRMPPHEGTGVVFDKFCGTPPNEAAKKNRDVIFRCLCEIMAIDRYLPTENALAEKFRHFSEYVQVTDNQRI